MRIIAQVSLRITRRCSMKRNPNIKSTVTNRTTQIDACPRKNHIVGITKTVNFSKHAIKMRPWFSFMFLLTI